MNVGNTILNLLERNNMSQRELASRLQIAPTTLNGYIKNNHEPDCETLIKIAEVFNVSLDHLLSYSSKHKPEEMKLLDDFRTLSPSQKELVVSLVETMLNQNIK